ncbi:MAG TPA: histone deacetylase family protein [Acidimicrobiia bacterium]|nr:histone deacetylase family protein [Acidimicrobiia bacterium]
MKVVYSPDLTRHDPAAEIWVGVRIVGTEVARRVELVAAATEAQGHQLVAPRLVTAAELEAVHDPGLVEFLRTAWSRWQESGYPREPGQDRVVPYVFPLYSFSSGRPPRRPASVAALAGLYAFDTMTLIGPGSWEAIEAAASCAVTAVDLVVAGEQVAFAAVRPPGHHAGRDFYGGSCYLNNSAIAASRLVAPTGGPVSVIDLDAHHGNGTQEIFYRRADVRYGSVHIDPAAGYFPHFLGFATERGEGQGEGANLNVPIPPGTGDREWLSAVEELRDLADGSRAIVVSLGVDAWSDDPESPLEVTHDGYRTAGTLLGEMGLPTVIVLEGGYDLAEIAALTTSFLDGFLGTSSTGPSG